ncbi:reducing type I polyketide synthase [Karstenula rhodostoma CBS 690.94]|uniref:Reducing type I polyketide synthase n=1 Tax=Karstenula rhodostoma CBS 690.94 TaxID=1392251 RepID=A0A9P4UAE1_9PLEO|nr:reducing type I polyketide synthase [Karstenula rhodostoma CBS 690.94]
MVVNDVFSASHLRNGDEHVVHGADPLILPTQGGLLTEQELTSLPANVTAKESSQSDIRTPHGHPNGDLHQEHGHKQPATTGRGPVTQSLHPKVDLEPLAIIGMAFQFPDGSTTEEDFWDMLVEKRCASREYPKERLNIDAFHSADTKKPGSIHSKNAHFLEKNIYDFDPAFFSISPADAKGMDPCQRTLLETTYHALEDSGLSLTNVSGSKTSVHVGCFSSDHMISAFRDSERMPKYAATGVSSAMLSNRLSWFFNLHGPSITLDTACSSGMVALDLACQGLWSGQTNMAIVAASNLNLSPELNISLSNMGFLSPDGRCFSFDHRANGYARGEGVATLVIKPLSKAIESGNQIRALIRSIGSNQDGRTNGGITQPSRAMQAELIRETYRRAGADLDMSKTRFFEAHGTGTAIGDPTEAQAIGECFREHRSDNEPLFVGAVKSNIGHTEGTSGLAGIIKAVLALEKGIIPPNTNFECLNPEIDGEFYRLVFPQECIEWPSVPGEIRRASVNSFGFGGANAHVVLDDARSYLQAHHLRGKHRTIPAKHAFAVAHTNGDTTQVVSKNGRDTFVPQLLVFSAFDKGGMERQSGAHSAYIKRFRGCYPPDFFSNYAFTLATCRTMHTWKSFCILENHNDGENLERLLEHGPASSASLLNLGLLFTGQGAQWHGMGRELLSNTIFAESVSRSQQYLSELGCGWSIVSRLTDDKFSRFIGEAQYSQVLTTVVQLALVDLISYFGIAPSVAVGHSSGEIAAAYSAGLISHCSAIKISYFRGFLGSELENAPGVKWGMAAIGFSKEDVEQEFHMLWGGNSSIVVSCINSPSTVTVSGPETDLDVLVSRMISRDIFSRKLRVKLGYHSPQMRLISARYLEMLGTLDPGSPSGSPKPLMVSSVTGDVVDRETVCSGAYWVENMVSVVNFLGAIERCTQFPTTTKVWKTLGSNRTNHLHVQGWFEVGPHPALQGPIREILTPISGIKEVRYTSALVRGKSAASTILKAAGYLHCHSFRVNLANVTTLGMRKEEIESRTMSDVPFYQFKHDIRYWDESAMNINFRLRPYGSNALLGTRIGDPNPFEAEWRFLIQEDDMPWIRDHKVNGAVLYPAAGMLTMAIEATRQLSSQSPLEALQLEDVSIPAPIVIPATGEQVEVRFHLSSSHERAEVHNFRIFLCKPDTSHEMVCHGKVRRIVQRAKSEVDNGRDTREGAAQLESEYDDISVSCTHEISADKLYRAFGEKLGLEYGPAFQALRRVHFDNAGHAIASLVDYEAGPSSSFVIHPTRLDSMFQLCFPATRSMDELETMVPTHIRRLWVPVSSSSQHSSYQHEKAVYATAKSALRRNATFSIRAIETSTKRAIVEVDGLQLTSISNKSEKVKTLADASYVCGHMDWRVDLDTLDCEDMRRFCEEARPARPAPKQRFQAITNLCLHFGAQTLTEVAEDEIIPSMKKYATWFRGHLERTPMSPKMTPEAVEQLCASLLPSTSVELQITIGQQLANILRGEVDPLQLFFTDEGKMTKFYAEAMEDATSQMPLRRYLDSLTHKTPNLNFLEVGAGTGGSTTEIMKTIGNSATSVAFEHYTYTDISPSFFEQAQERFAALNHRMTYRTLDVERDPIPQGYEAGAYDVIIADNVLHATKDLCRTLRHVHSLLKPGGKLIMRELTAPHEVQTGYIFGLLPGWWLGTEKTRQLSPVIDVQTWGQVMHGCGFSGADLVLPDYPGGECSQLSFIVSTAVHPPVSLLEAPVPASIPPKFIVDPSSDYQSALATSITLSLGCYRQIPDMMSLADAASLATREAFAHEFIFLNETEAPIVHCMEELTFTTIKAVLASARSILWVKQGGGGGSPSNPEYAASDGLCRVSRNENPRVGLVTLALETSSLENAPHVAKIFQRMHDKSTVETEFKMIQGRPHINRVRRAKYLDEHIFKRTARPVVHQKASGQRLRIGIRVPGLLDTIEYTQDQIDNSMLPAEEIEIEIKAIGINYKDLITLLGQGKSDSLGCEYTGVVLATGSRVVGINTGDRVAGIPNEQAIQTYSRAHVKNVVRIPENLTFAEAAAIPVAYCTAYYSLVEVARLQPGEAVLIHSAAGGTGQAMIQVAQWIGATVYATVSDVRKKTLLMDVYGLSESHIFSSRDASFATGVERSTKVGVDVVINSLSGTLMEASWSCVAPFGRFVEIGLKDAHLRRNLPMHTFTKNVSFSSVDMELIFLRKDHMCERLLREVFDLFAQGTLKVAQPQLYSLGEIQEAFRYLQSGKSSGKMVVEVGTEDVLPIVQGQYSSYRLREDASYIIAGGLGSIGRSIARWLVSRGAKNLILLSRSGPKQDDEQLQCMLADIRRAGVKVECPVCDIAERSVLEKAIKDLSTKMPPIKGCIQAAMVLHDATLSTMSIAEWKTAVRPKVDGSWNLHLALPSGMDFFVLLSSVAGIFGNGGQANYASGNTYEDALAAFRASQGESAISLDIGYVLEDGFEAKSKASLDRISTFLKLRPSSMSEIIAMLDYYCQPGLLPTANQSQVITGLELPADMQSKGHEVPSVMHNPLFRHLFQVESSSAPIRESATRQQMSVKSALVSASSTEEGGRIIAEALKEKLTRVLGVPHEHIDIGDSLVSYGVDSLVGLELRNWLMKETDADLAVFDILSGSTLEEIGQTAAARSLLRNKE